MLKSGSPAGWKSVLDSIFPDLKRGRHAVFSEDRAYRYWLKITWDEDKPVFCFCGLNPSTADEVKNDPTVERCERRARRGGYGSLIVVNIFAYRATDPMEMKRQVDPVGALNDKWIYGAVCEAETFMCGWGNHGRHLGRGEQVIEMLGNFDLHCLGVSKEGQPVHPLYQPYSSQVRLFRQRVAI